MVVCVCVCVRERERESSGGGGVEIERVGSINSVQIYSGSISISI